MNKPKKARAAVVVTLTEPEVWAVIRAHKFAVVPASPFALMAQSATTLDQLLAAGRQGLQAQNLMDGDRINYVLAAAVRVLCHPQECISLVERGALGTLMRAFYGANGLFIGHTPLVGSHTLTFPYTRGMLIGIAAQTMGLDAPAESGSGRRG